MDIISNPLFWGEVGLAASSKLALLAAVLWVARLAIPARAPHMADMPPAPRFLREGRVPRAGADSSLAMPPRTDAAPRAVSGYVNLRRPPERVASAPASADQMRQRLLEYVERRSAGRAHL